VSRSESPPQAPITIDADLTLTRDGTDYRITATDNTVTVDSPSLGAAVSLFRSLPADQRDRLEPLLSTTGVTVTVAVDGQRVATLEPAPGWTPGGPDGFELQSFDVHPKGVAVSVIRELGRHPIALFTAALVTLWLVRRLRRGRGASG
jgi:hypothetical protein